MAKGKSSQKPKTSARVRPGRAGPNVLRSLSSLFFSLLLGSLLLGVLGLSLYMLYLDAVIRAEFDQKRWAMPAKVFARPLELFETMSLSADAFAQELKLLNYHDVNCPEAPPSVPSGKRPLRRKSQPPPPEVCAPPPGGGKSPDRAGTFARRGGNFRGCDP